MSVYRGSRYVKTPARVQDGTTLMLKLRDRVIFNENSCSYYTVLKGDTIDGISYKLYGNAKYWWAIMDANPRFESEIEVKPGDVLMIPPFDEVVRACE